jgi:hypothetical protein
MANLKHDIKNLLIKSHLYPAHRYVKLKYHNYLGELGLYRQIWNQTFAKLDRDLHCKERQQIALKFKKSAPAIIKEVAEHLRAHGYLQTTFKELGVNADEVFLFLKEKVDSFMPKADDIRNYDTLGSGKYANQALSYHLYRINKGMSNDLLLEFVMDSNLIQLASLYTGYLPILDLICLTVTPSHQGVKQFGAQLWHKDLHHKNSLKMFYTPQTLTHENGPFEYFSPKYSTLKYYRDAPQSMTDESLAQAGLDPKSSHSFLGGMGNVLLIDTARCLHRGGITKKPRFLTTMGYFSPLHNFRKPVYKQTGHYKIAFEDLRSSNEALLKQYA